jgi:hypothetical protein
MIIWQIGGSTVGPVLWVYLSVFAIPAVLSALLVYRQDKKKIGIHFASMGIVLALTLMAGLF